MSETSDRNRVLLIGNVAKYTLQGITKVPSGVAVDYFYPDSMVHVGACKAGSVFPSCFTSPCPFPFLRFRISFSLRIDI